MCALQRPLTYDDFLALPDDGLRYELIGGELYVTPSPRRDHQEISANLHVHLSLTLRSTGAGKAYAHPVDVYLSRTDIVQPDLLAIRTSRLGIYRPEGVVEGPPDLVVEILSPSSRGFDRVRKMALYAKSSVQEYWIVDPEERMLTLYALEDAAFVVVEPNADGTFNSRVFPELRVDLAVIFEGLDDDTYEAD